MYQCTTKYVRDNVFEADVDGHKVVMDTGSPEKAGQSPMEILLSAISGCASVDVVEIMRKKRRTVAGLRVEVEAVREAEAYPRIFNEIKLHFVLTSSDAKQKELDQAVSLSVEKYCSVAGMLDKAATITWTAAIESQAPEVGGDR